MMSVGVVVACCSCVLVLVSTVSLKWQDQIAALIRQKLQTRKMIFHTM